MKIQGQSHINFTSRISDQVLHKIDFEKMFYDKQFKTLKNVQDKIENVKKWGNNNSELVIAKNLYGKKCLGLKTPLNEHDTVFWEIRNLPGRTILSNFLNLHESHIISTEKSIKYLYKKYGIDVFSKVK